MRQPTALLRPEPRPIARPRVHEIRADHGEALVVVRSGDQRMELEIRFEAGGPVVRARACALELTAAERITASCETFRVEAARDIELVAKGELRCEAASVSAEAATGGMKLCANDDVQLLGERILLNCDPPAPMPAWVEEPPPAPLPCADASGDQALIHDLRADEPCE